MRADREFGSFRYEAIPAILAGAAVAGTAVSAYSSYASGQQASKAAAYNAQTADLQAQQARDAAKIDAENQQEAARRVQGQTRARIAASGVEQSEGSPLLTIMDNARQAEIEKQRILYGGELRATGLQNQATLSRYQGGQAATAGFYGAGINLLSGISSAGLQYYRGGKSARSLGWDGS